METDSVILGIIGIRRSCREERYANFTSKSCSLVNVIVASMLIAATLQRPRPTKLWLGVHLAWVVALRNGSIDLGLQVRGGSPTTTRRVGECQAMKRYYPKGVAIHHRNITGGIPGEWRKWLHGFWGKPLAWLEPRSERGE